MKKVRKIIAIILACAWMLNMTACGFSVGNVGGNESYKELFPDKAATLDKKYKTSDMGYKFSVGDYEMMVYVDTSEGHQFEVISEPAGFQVKDAEGNACLYAACLDKEQYSMMTAYCIDTMTINGRNFYYLENEDGSMDCYSYMADCGMDYGLVMEVHGSDTDSFGLVAFRGTPLDGASSEQSTYKGNLEDFLPDVSDIADDYTDDFSNDDYYKDDTTDTNDSDNSGAISYLDGKVQESIDHLSSDYNKVLWATTYDMGDELPGIVISVAPSVMFDNKVLIIGVTNLYDKDIMFSASAAAKDADDNIIGDSFFFNTCIGVGNTAINMIDCGSAQPDGRISWTDVEVYEATNSYVDWAADYAVSGNPKDGYVTVDYEMYAEDGNSAFNGDLITIMLLSKEGYIIGIGSDYASETSAGEKINSQTEIYATPEDLALTADVAIFANPYEP